MTFNSKQYRDFCEVFFRFEIEHQEHDPSSMTKNEKLLLIEKSKRFSEVYFKYFGVSPPKCIWPEITLDSWEDNESFVFINITKVLMMKYYIKKCSQSLNRKDVMLELNSFSKLSQKKHFGLRVFKKIINKFGGNHQYRPIKYSVENSVLKRMSDQVVLDKEDSGNLEKCDFNEDMNEDHQIKYLSKEETKSRENDKDNYDEKDAEKKVNLNEWRIKYFRFLRDEHNKENKTNFIKEQNQDLLEYHDAFSKNGVIFTSHMRVEQLLSTSLNDLRESIQSAYYECPKASYVESIVDEQQKN